MALSAALHHSRGVGPELHEASWWGELRGAGSEAHAEPSRLEHAVVHQYVAKTKVTKRKEEEEEEEAGVPVH